MRINAGLALLVAVFAAGCTAKRLPSQPPLSVTPVKFSANEQRIPSQAVVIADASGTTYMAQTFPYVKALAQSFVKAMPEGNTRARITGNYEATLIGFGGKDRIVSPLAPFNRSALIRQAAWRREQGRDYAVEAAMAKTLASETATRCANRAVQILGGYGYIREYHVERYLRDAKITELYEGTSDMQRITIGKGLRKRS